MTDIHMLLNKKTDSEEHVPFADVDEDASFDDKFSDLAQDAAPTPLGRWCIFTIWSGNMTPLRNNFKSL